ncbi:HD domain-containing protein [Thalassobacillus hwangdonensis]|uniref:HD domain-containing protein n=1 Tax=Thalassobacillus hwangdonensis TaxID=546108 RepID=A0ABW3L0B7_9BACI
MSLQEKAKKFATEAHKGQKRKNSDEDYIVHPIRVAETLRNAKLPEAVICSGYLHDVVEDTTVELEDIETEFGKEIRDIVAAHTEDKSKSWKERKQHTIDTVKTGSKEVKWLIVADKLDNLLSLERALEEKGSQVWKNFNAGPAKQQWYNESVASVMFDGLNEQDTPEYFKTYEDAVRRVFHQ